MDQKDEIKSKIDLVELINSYVPLKKAGANFRACCPFHSEKTPSFMVSPERQIWKCFGCQLGGDVYTFYMQIENVDFGQAIKELAKRAGVQLQSYQPTKAEKDKDLLFEINHLATEYYHYILLNLPIGKKALDYILGRGVSHESLEKFQIGYSPDSWRSLQSFLVGKKKYLTTDLEKAGLVSRNNRGYFDRFRGRLMFPLKDHRGNVCGFAGRVLDPLAKEAKYINTQDTQIYHKSDLLFGLNEAKEVIKQAQSVILTEGELDMISSFQAGVKNVVAIKGSALTLSQIKLLKRFTQTLIFALDADFAGDKAARRGIELADQEGLTLKVIEIIGGKDPDDVAQKNPELWKKLAENPIGIYDYFINSAFTRFDSSVSDGKKKIGDELTPILAKINNQIVFSHYVNLLSHKLDISQEALLAEIKKAPKEQEVLDKMPTKDVEKDKTRRETIEEYLLALAFQLKKPEWLTKKVFSVVKTSRYSQILKALSALKGDFQSEEFARSLPAELLAVYNHLYLINLGDLSPDEPKNKDEFAQTLKDLTDLSRHEKLLTIRRKIDELECKPNLSRQENQLLDKYIGKFAEISAKLAQKE